MRGEETVDLASLSDPVLVREDGTYLYTLPSVVDDIDMGITHVIRGDDHVTNTGVQIALFRALGAEPPAFGHHNLLTTASGEGLSKRTGALSIGSLRESGHRADGGRVAGRTHRHVGKRHGAADDGRACRAFRSGRRSKSAAKFDPADLLVLNRTLLHDMPFSEARDRLAVLGDLRRQGGGVLAGGARQCRHACRTPQIGGASSATDRLKAPELLGRRSRLCPRRHSIFCRKSLGTGRPGRAGRTR